MATTAQTLIQDALYEINVYSDGQTILPADLQRGLRLLNRDIMDPWSVQKEFAFSRQYISPNFPQGAASITLGPSGNAVDVNGAKIQPTPRPVEILNATAVYSNNLNRVVEVRDEAWYYNLNYPTFQSIYITSLYYQRDTPNGTLYAWPQPSAAQVINLVLLLAASQFTDTTTIYTLAPGYESAICLTLKEIFCRAWNRPLPDGLASAAAMARAVIQMRNSNRRRPLRTDAPSTVTSPVGSDIVGFRTRQF